MGGFFGCIVKPGSALTAEQIGRLLSCPEKISRNSSDNIVDIVHDHFRFSYFHLNDDACHAPNPWCVVGDPIVSDDETVLSAIDGSREMIRALQGGDTGFLDRCYGSYSAFFYDEDKRKLNLLSDKFGTRPVYYFDSGDFFAFSTSRRVIFGLCEGFISTDPIALGQQIYARQIFGNRTLASEIKTLKGGECLCLEVGRVEVRQYYDIEKTPKRDVPYETAVGMVFDTFLKAVRRRAIEPRAYAMLSGGLDSRAVVAALRELDVDVQSFAIAKPNTPDARLSPLVAQQLGTRHRLVEAALMERVRSAPFMGYARRYMPQPPMFPPLDSVWSGDGGSVVLGHVYMTERNTALAEANDIEAAVLDLFPAFKREKSDKALRSAQAENLKREALASVCNEMSSIRESERRLFLFLLRNDQERHLYEYFENIDIWRINPVLPFFDPDFVEIVYSLPQEYFLKHRIYNDFISRFKMGADRIPWQVYRDHIPGPLKMDNDGKDQWYYASIFEKEPKEAYLVWIKAYRALPLRDLGKYINPWFVVSWYVRAQLGLIDGPHGIRLISRLVLLCGQLTDGSGRADLGAKATIRDF